MATQQSDETAMAAASTGSIIFFSTALLSICIAVVLLLRHYLPLRSTPGYLLFPVFLALALPSSIIVLVPIDLASTENATLKDHVGGIWLPERVVLTTWRITYWLTFVLTWVILPILGEYCDSGDRETSARILYSLRSNLRYQLIVVGLGIFGFIYFVFENGFHLSSIRGLVMALAYAWGLFLAIGLMGHGLVTLPRRLFKNASISGRLKQLQSKAPLVKERLEEARDDLDVLERTVTQLKLRKTGISGDMREWIEELAETCPIPDVRPGDITPARESSAAAAPPVVLSEKYMADLTRKLKRSRHRHARFADEWLRLCAEAQDTQAILDAASTQNLPFDRGHGRSLKLIDGSTRFYLYFYVLPYASAALAVFLACASVGIVWSEVTAAFLPRISLIGITTLPSIDGKFGFGNQIIAASWLLYMCTVTLYALSDVKVWGNRALVKRQTYGESACWYALQVAKLTVPLSYNFITMMPSKKLYQGTGFYQLLGQFVDLTPLGYGFSLFFPCFIVGSALASVFNLYGKVQNLLGFGILIDNEEDGRLKFGSGSWREGRTLIERELQTNASRGIVGLHERGDSLDIERRPADSSRPERRPPPQQRVFNAVTNEEETVDDSPRHFYQDLGERIRNTVDTAETPQWMKRLGSNFKTPKWMQNEQQNEQQNEGGQSRPAFSRFFSRGSDEGRLRL